MLVNALGNRKVLEKLNILSRITTSQPKASLAPLKLANVLSTPKSSLVAQTLKTSTVVHTPKTPSVAHTPNTFSVAWTPKKPESLTTVVSERPSTPGPFDKVNVETPNMEDSQFDMNKIRVSFFCCFLAYLL